MRLQVKRAVFLAEYHVKISGGDYRATRSQGLAGHALADGQRRLRRETRRQQGCKNSRHVLHDDDRHGQVCRQRRQNPGQSVRSSSGDANCHNLYLGRKSRQRASDRGWGRRFRGRRRGKFILHFGQLAKSTNLRDEFAGDGIESGHDVAVTGFGDVVGNANDRASSVTTAPCSVRLLNMMMGTWGSFLRSSRTVASPSVSGISKSRRTMSGFTAEKLASALRPLPAVPETSRSWSFARARDRALRTDAPSLTRSTRFLMATCTSVSFRASSLNCLRRRSCS